jgi:hypothetical protein
MKAAFCFTIGPFSLGSSAFLVSCFWFLVLLVLNPLSIFYFVFCLFMVSCLKLFCSSFCPFCLIYVNLMFPLHFFFYVPYVPMCFKKIGKQPSGPTAY